MPKAPTAYIIIFTTRLERERDRETDRERDGERQREREKERERERETDRQTVTERQNPKAPTAYIIMFLADRTGWNTDK